MKKLFLLFLFCTSIIWLNAQEIFPNKCLGVWEGMMYIYGKSALRDSVQVKFTAGKTADPNSWTWKMEYLSEKMPMVKDYILRLKNKEEGIFVVDEGGGLELYDYRFGNKLYNVFETQGILLTSSYELIGEKLIFEVTSGKKLEGEKMGVTNYSVTNLQRVVLTKIE